MWVKSSFVRVIAAGSDHQPNINYVNNPTGSGVTPLFVAEMAALYRRGFVEKVKYQIIIQSPSAVGPSILGFVPSTSGAGLGGIGDIASLDQYQHAKTYVLLAGASPQTEVIATDTVRVKDFYDYKDWQDSEELVTDLNTPTAPTKKVYLHCVNLSSNSVTVVIKTILLVHFFSPFFSNV